MTLNRVFTFMALVGTVFSQTPPGFSPASSVYFPVTYDTSASPSFFVNGGLFSKQVVQHIPDVYIPEDPSFTGKTFLVLMVDPDAPSPQNASLGQILHWLQPGVQVPINTKKVRSSDNSTTYLKLDTTSVRSIAPYRGPAPPSQAPHRYTLMLFLQPNEDFSLPPSFKKYQGGNDRRFFNTTKFIEAAGLGDPIAGNYFLSGVSTDGDGSQVIQDFDGTPSASKTSSAGVFVVQATGSPATTGNSSSPTFPTPTPTETHNGAAKLGGNVFILTAVFSMLYFLI
ncbi:hypothetical protein TWF694_009396 [Orbilia ellipsospora]|uniref:PEBP-like protein n=1 Tax=Orbilia ellipsospora TaxID=2528407 RepID=A0AAV9XDQ9_9PEZI